jgi:hypothetical protein
MLKLTYIRSGLVAAIFTLLTTSFASVPQPEPIRKRPCALLSGTINNSSSEIFEANQAQAASIGGGTIYYTLRRDLRRCAFPLCGGYFVRRVNHPLTRCVSGKFMKECYVAEIDWNGHPQIEVNGALLRGKIMNKSYVKPGKPPMAFLWTVGEFGVTESWQSAGDQISNGLFYRVKDRGVRCITHPCLTHLEVKLNSTAQRNIAGVDLSGARVPESRVSEAFEQMTRPDGVIIAGSHLPVTGPAGKSIMLKASQFYLRVVKDLGSKTNKACIRTGCSGQVCADTEVITTCEWRPEYACYKGSRCERQADGKCGFTMTPELKACLAKVKN